ncbi:MAG: inorganic phosphate transporter [Flavobacteriales bacterium]|jgi:PiT family inorganic phosphate transporter|nr:inorganic phosphate transporter [Flavobacteriales bacterium]MBK6893993.1 inorganic phosphate transporter [Flavobacteriales bacterium]MBK7247941.1 inorganic phosphate transporter [Flavobacteriales bacterium]MBK9060858.1 inorganic phosphate transporter [Flavobacteriales bacterium]QQS73210.1 MAG: inorganic phosphate transporter [Flavobacteriales bacterium]
MSLLVVIIILALVFDYINGFHDAANSIATVVSTKVLTPFQAVMWAAMFNFAAFFIFKDHAVANTISKTVHQEFITLPVILSGLVAAIIWNLLTWWYGIPSSSSHTLIGGFAGAALTHAFSTQNGVSVASVVEMGMIMKIVAFIFLAPLLGMAISMFVSLVTLVENTWYRVSLIVLTSIFTWFLFIHLQENKMQDNIAGVLQVNTLQEQVLMDPAFTADYEEASRQLDEATPLLALYPNIGAEGVAKRIIHDVAPALDQDKLTKAIAKGDNSYIRYGMMLFSLIFILTYLYVEKIRTPNAFSMAKMFKRLQLLSSAAISIGHGGNDAQKVMGIIAAALIAGGEIQDFKDMPTWVPLACYTAIALGTMSGGWKIIKTMGTRITKVTPLEGVCAESGGAITLYLTEQMGIPVSTTHTITGSIIGVGATKRLSAVRWGVTIRLLWAWIITIPVSAAIAAVAYWICVALGL